MKRIIYFLCATCIGITCALLPSPDGVDPKGMRLLGTFAFTLIVFMTKTLPMGATCILSITLLILTKTLAFGEALSGFSHPVVWLVVVIFFISKAFLKTGLGFRIAYYIMKKMGKTTLGMGYGLVLVDLILAPAIPSVTARCGGVIYPMLNALSRVFDSTPQEGPRRMGAFLIQNTFQGTLITSAMFLTAMAGNPFIVDIARDHSIFITWGSWALAASVPGLVSLLIIPFFLYCIYPPNIKQTPRAAASAERQLKKMGKMARNEKIMLGVFSLLLVLWITGPFYHLTAVTAAFIGLSILLLFRIMSWHDLIEEKRAWDTLTWFATLLMLATYLNRFGLTVWFGAFITNHIGGLSWQWGFAVLSLIYFFSHYFFVSNIAHIGSMYAPFLVMAIMMGTPPLFAGLTLGFFSSLFGGLTHYGCGPAPILFGAGYVSLNRWWLIGLLCAFVNIIIWLGIGWYWWPFSIQLFTK